MNEQLTMQLMQTSIGLVLVLGLFVIFAWLLKRGKFSQIGNKNHLEVISGVALSAKDRIILLKAGKKQLLVGLSPGNIRTLHVFDKEDEILLEDKESGKFAKTLKQTLKYNK